MIAAAQDAFLNWFEDAALVVVEFDRAMVWSHRIARMLDPLDAFGESADEAFFEKGVDRPRAGLREPRQVPLFERVSFLAKKVEHNSLFWRQIGHGVGQFAFRNGFDEDALARSGLIADAGREHGLEDLAPATQVVIGHPARQAQEGIGEQGLVVEDSAHALDGADGLIVADTNAIADCATIASAERHFNALADADLGYELIRNGVGIGLIQGPVEDNVGEKGGRGLLIGDIGACGEEILGNIGGIAHPFRVIDMRRGAMFVA